LSEINEHYETKTKIDTLVRFNIMLNFLNKLGAEVCMSVLGTLSRGKKT